MDPVLHIALLRPEIPQNTGNIGRLCAITGCRLHLIHPLGFTVSDRHLKRSGMDYWHSLDKSEHNSWSDFRQEFPTTKRIWLFTTKAKQVFWDAEFREGDVLLFGNEGSGCPPEVHSEIGLDHSLTIPQYNPKLRSLNLSTSVGIATYEALRQIQPNPNRS